MTAISMSVKVINIDTDEKPVCDFLTYFVSYTAFEISLWRIIGPIFAVDRGGVHVFIALAGCERLNSKFRKLAPKTGNIRLSCGAKIFRNLEPFRRDSRT